MKKVYLTLCLCFITTAMLMVACRKDISSNGSESQIIDFKIQEKEDLGRVESTIYNHLTYFAATPAESYLAEPKRKEFREHVDKNESIFRNNSFVKNIDVAIAKKVISPESKGEWLKIDKFINEYPARRTNFSECSLELDNLIQEFEMSSLKTRDKSSLKQYTAILKALTHYGFEIEKRLVTQNALNARQSCGFWEKLWCYSWHIYGGYVLGGLTGCLVGEESCGQNSQDGQVTEIMGLVGAILGIVWAINDCECIVCDAPDALAITQLDCDGNATAVAMGAGEDAKLFRWDNKDGLPATAITSATFEGGSELRVRQTGTAAIKTTVGPIGNTICDNADRLSQSFDIRSIARDPGAVFLSSNGENQSNIKVGSQLLYFIGGPAVSSGRSTFSVMWGNTVGSATFLGGNWFRVYFWKTGTGTMSIQATNTCSGQSTFSSQLQVTVVN